MKIYLPRVPDMQSYLCQGGHEAFAYLTYSTTYADLDFVCSSDLPIPYDVQSHGRATRTTVPGTRTDFMIIYMSVSIGCEKARGFEKELLIRK
jgi:hypothetical protein